MSDWVGAEPYCSGSIQGNGTVEGERRVAATLWGRRNAAESLANTAAAAACVTHTAGAGHAACAAVACVANIGRPLQTVVREASHFVTESPRPLDSFTHVTPPRAGPATPGPTVAPRQRL